MEPFPSSSYQISSNVTYLNSSLQLENDVALPVIPATVTDCVGCDDDNEKQYRQRKSSEATLSSVTTGTTIIPTDALSHSNSAIHQCY